MPSTLSIRLSDENRARLDSAAKKTHRSRSYLINSLIEQQLRDAEAARPESAAPKAGRLDRLRAMKGVGAKLYGPRTQENIDAQVREFRGDE